MRTHRIPRLAAIGAIAAALTLAATAQQALAGADSKNVSDGAAKGQASEGVAPKPAGSCDLGMAIKNSGVPKNTAAAVPNPACSTPKGAAGAYDQNSGAYAGKRQH
jgi:hypothetical protein